MVTVQYKAGAVARVFVSQAVARTSFVDDGVDLPDDHPDVLGYQARYRATAAKAVADRADEGAKAKALLAALAAGTATNKEMQKVLAFLVRMMLP